MWLCVARIVANPLDGSVTAASYVLVDNPLGGKPVLPILPRLPGSKRAQLQGQSADNSSSNASKGGKETRSSSL